jgi:hypothetical protein
MRTAVPKKSDRPLAPECRRRARTFRASALPREHFKSVISDAELRV